MEEIGFTLAIVSVTPFTEIRNFLGVVHAQKNGFSFDCMSATDEKVMRKPNPIKKPLIYWGFNKKAVPHHTERRCSAKAYAACLGRKGLATATALLGVRI